MSKGKVTREHILKNAFTIASESGLESLTIGLLAKACGMSKSGLFSHFNSKENLQVAVLEYSGLCFRQRVIEPARDQFPNDIEAKLKLLLTKWLQWNHSFQGSCMFLDAWKDTTESNDSVQKELKKIIQIWVNYLTIQIEKGQSLGVFSADLDPKQAVFQLYGVYLSSHLFYSIEVENQSRDMFWQGVEQLLSQWRVEP